MSNANDNGPPAWQELLHAQSYGTLPEVEPPGFDPGEHTVAEVQDYLADHPDEADAVLAAEAAGKNRATLTG